MKFIWLLLLAAAAWRLLAGRWPWQPRGGRRNAPDVTRARNLLGVDAQADRAAVIDAHRRLVAQVHPDRGGTSQLVHEANAARDLLLAAIHASGQEPE